MAVEHDSGVSSNERQYVIDFDSTLIAGESLDLLAEAALDGRMDAEEVLSQLAGITASGMCGGLPFNESLQRRMTLFEASRAHVDALATKLGTLLTPSAVENADWFHANSHRLYVVSGGFEEYIQPTVALLGIRPNHVFANRFIYNDAGDIIGFDADRLTSQPHGKAKQTVALRLGGPVIAIGDGSTDLEIRDQGAADAFWAFTAHVRRPGVADQADLEFDDFVLLTAE